MTVSVLRLTPAGEYRPQWSHVRLPDAAHSELGLNFVAYLTQSEQPDPGLVEPGWYRNRKNRKPYVAVMEGIVVGRVEICHELLGQLHTYYLAAYAHDGVAAYIRPTQSESGFQAKFIPIGPVMHQSELEEER